jgi:hypothetical protein
VIVRLPWRVRLTDTADSERLAQRALEARAKFQPNAGFLVDVPLTRLPERDYSPLPGSLTPNNSKA